METRLKSADTGPMAWPYDAKTIFPSLPILHMCNLQDKIQMLKVYLSIFTESNLEINSSCDRRQSTYPKTFNDVLLGIFWWLLGSSFCGCFCISWFCRLFLCCSSLSAKIRTLFHFLSSSCWVGEIRHGVRSTTGNTYLILSNLMIWNLCWA